MIDVLGMGGLGMGGEDLDTGKPMQAKPGAVTESCKRKVRFEAFYLPFDTKQYIV